MQKKWIKPLLFFITQFIFWQIVFNNQQLSALWFNTITLNYNKLIYAISSRINFPIGEVLYLILFIFILFVCIKAIRERALSLMINTLTLVYFIYNALWGVAYYKETFSNQTTDLEIDQTYLKELYCQHLNQAEYYRSIITTDTEQAVKFDLKTDDFLNDFKKQEVYLHQYNWIYNYQSIENPKIKFSNISMLMNYAGVLGYYNPFSIESNINRYNTDLKMAPTIFHELAHQMGFASENQANFIAYFIGIHSDYTKVRYATYYKTMFSLLNAIHNFDPLFTLAQLESIPKGINTDRTAEIDYYSKYEGKANDTFSVLNDHFLKANNQDGKISYSRYIELVYYYQKNK